MGHISSPSRNRIKARKSSSLTKGAYVNHGKSTRRVPRRGRKREARSMGRYPFLIIAHEYLGKREAYLSKSTLEERKRKAQRLNRILVDLRRSGLITTTSPKKLTEEDISAIIQWMRGEELSNDYLVSILVFLKQVCEFAGNSVFARIKAGGNELPKKTPKDLQAISEDDLKIILAKTGELRGWRGEVCRFLVWMYPFTGLRTSELRLANIEDIDTRRWTIWVRHPKGEMRYARQRTAPILPPARAAVSHFLEARDARLKKLNIKSQALIPTQTGGYYSSNGFREMRRDFEKKLNEGFEKDEITFTFKKFRETFCQMNIDRDPSLTASVSLAMGHSSTKTTEAFYGRIKSDRALDDLNRLWEARPDLGPAKPKTPSPNPGFEGNKSLIERKFDISGYA